MHNEWDMTADEMKELARIEKILEKNNLEVDKETEEIVRYIVRGNNITGVEKLLSKTWCINKLIQLWGDRNTNPSVRQRSFEFLCDLLGYTPQGKTQSNVMDVIIDTAK